MKMNAICTGAFISLMLFAGQGAPAQQRIDAPWIMMSQTSSVDFFDARWAWTGTYGQVMDSLFVDEDGIAFGNSFNEFYRWTFDPTAIPAFQRSTKLAAQTAWPIASLRRGLLCNLGAFGQWGWLDRTTPLQQPRPGGNFMVGAGFPPGTPAGFHCSNGREAFSLVSPASGAPVILAVDLARPGNPMRTVADLGGSQRGWSVLRLTRDGDLVLMDWDTLKIVDPRTGAVRAVAGYPPGWSVPVLGYSDLAYDPWRDEIAVAPKWPVQQTYIYSDDLSNPTGWTLRFSLPFLHGMRALLSTAEPPFELFGLGCVNGTGKDPRLGWAGIPRQGDAFTVELFQAEPNGLALFWLGLSDSSWAPVGSLPWNAAPLGAPGCALLVSPDWVTLASVDGNGEASVTYPVPVSPVFAGLEIYAQTASSSSANTLGLAASDALQIRMR